MRSAVPFHIPFASGRTVVLTMILLLSTTLPALAQVTRCPPVCTREQGLQNRINDSANRFRPTLDSLAVDGGAQVTTTSSVTIEIWATKATHMKISERSDFQGAAWQPLQTRFQFPLSTTLGEKTIHVILANEMRGGLSRLSGAPGPTSVVARRVIEYWNPRINAVEVFTRDGSQRINASSSREVMVRLDLLGSATQYRVASAADDLSRVPWRSDFNGRDFDLQLAPEIGIQRFQVEARNGIAGGSNRVEFAINYVGSRVFFVGGWDAFQEARSQGWSSRLRGCQPEALANSPSENVSGEPSSAGYEGLSLARHGRGCDGSLFRGRSLAPGWTLETDIGTFTASGQTGFVPAARPGSDQIEMRIACPRPSTGAVRPENRYDPDGCHVVRLVLRGPANADWRDAFKR